MLEFTRAIAWLLSPLTVAWLLAIAAWLARRHPRRSRALASIAFAVLWIGSTPLAADLVGSPLQRRYSAVAIAQAPAADAIVVLGGAIAGAQPPARPNIGLGGSADRVWQAAALYRAGKAPWLVVAAGNRDPRPGLQVEADAIAQMLVDLGVPRERIRIERASRTTRENATNALAIVRELGAHRVLLVTSALHLPRAVRTFEADWSGAGIALEPFPADVPPSADYFTIWSLLPSPGALGFVTRALKEYAGTVGLAII